MWDLRATIFASNSASGSQTSLLFLCLFPEHVLEAQVSELFRQGGRVRHLTLVYHLNNVANFIDEERHGPLEDIYVAGQVKRMVHIPVLLDVHAVFLDENHSAFVVELVAVVGRAEHSYDRGEAARAAPPVHLVPVDLHLVGTDYGYVVVFLDNILDGAEAEPDGALSLRVLKESVLLGFLVVHGVGPEQIAEESFEERFDKPVDRIDV